MGQCATSKSFEPGETLEEVPLHVTDNHFKDAICIGSGSFGTVSVVRATFSTELFAMKRIPKRRLFRKRNHSKLVWGERNALISCESPFVVPLYYAYQTENELILVMPFYTGGDLKYMVKTKGPTSIGALRFYMAEMLLGLEAMHANMFCHRDLKPENILISPEGHIAITDFGLAIKIAAEKDDRTRRWGQCGTFGYRAPEVVEDMVCGPLADIYSMGVVFYYMYFAQVPFKRTQYAIEGAPLNFPLLENHSDQNKAEAIHLFDLLNKMLDLLPEWRLDMDKIKAHEFFEGINWQDALEGKLLPPHVPQPAEANFFRVDLRKTPGADTRDAKAVLTDDHQACFSGFEYNYENPMVDTLRMPEMTYQLLNALGTPATHTKSVLYGRSRNTADVLTPKGSPKHLPANLPGTPTATVEKIHIREKPKDVYAEQKALIDSKRASGESTKRNSGGVKAQERAGGRVPQTAVAVSAMDRLLGHDKEYRDKMKH